MMEKRTSRETGKDLWFEDSLKPINVDSTNESTPNARTSSESGNT